MPPNSAQPDYGGERVNTGPADLLGSEVSDIASPSTTDGKYTAQEAAYERHGPKPFVCGNCDHFVAGRATSDGEGGNMCDLVVGPYPSGGVDAADSCRFWEKPNDRPVE